MRLNRGHPATKDSFWVALVVAFGPPVIPLAAA